MNRRKFIFTLVCAFILTAVLMMFTASWCSLEIPTVMTLSGGIFLAALVIVVWVSTVMYVCGTVKKDGDKNKK